jgi:capsule polysaccharide export protein KpsC/LpsZ
MSSGVPQGSLLGPLLYTLLNADIPQQNSTIMNTFADDTAVLSRHANLNTATTNLQTHLDSIANWTSKRRLKINENKSTHVTFTLWKGNIPQPYFNNNTIPQAETVKYLGLHFDKRLNWKHHIPQTRKHLNLKTRELY